MAKKNIESVLKRLMLRLDTVERLQQDLRDPPAGRLRDTINEIAVQGRSLINILGNLKRIAPSFGEWYTPVERQIESDELLVFFTNLRNASLKEGADGVKGVSVRANRSSLRIENTPEGVVLVTINLDGTETRSLHRKPANALSGFIGNPETGGAGWEVVSPKGVRSKTYFKPPSGFEIDLSFEHPPAMHLGKPISTNSAKALCDLYIAYLRSLVHDAVVRFDNRDESVLTTERLNDA